MIDTVRLMDLCREYGVPLTESQAQQLDLYGQMLVEWNEKINLTAITDPDGMTVKHFLDSLLLTKAIELPQGTSLIDVGTGAGFPSVPVKILRPDVNLTLLDSLNKRLVFLQELCQNLGLEVQYVHARAEDGGKDKKLREKYDFACARAVASLRNLCEYCLPFVKVGGAFIALKGPDWEEEPGGRQERHGHHGRQAGACGAVRSAGREQAGHPGDPESIANSASIPKNRRKNDKKTDHLSRFHRDSQENCGWKILDFKPAMWYSIPCKGIVRWQAFPLRSTPSIFFAVSIAHAAPSFITCAPDRLRGTPSKNHRLCLSM